MKRDGGRKGSRSSSHTRISRQITPDTCKGPEAGMTLACFGEIEATRVAGNDRSDEEAADGSGEISKGHFTKFSLAFDTELGAYKVRLNG